MKRVSIFLASAALSVGIHTCAASTSGLRAQSHHRTSAETFRILVNGSVSRNATFWLAYGPVAGTFGVVQLLQTSPGVYEASRTFPAGSHGVVAFLEGHGIMQTRAGKVPGNPVTVIRRTASIPLTTSAIMTVKWTAPRS